MFIILDSALPLMNTKQEIIDAINRENKGSPPPALFSQTGTWSLMESSGARWPEANFNPAAMIELALQPSRRFGFATVRIPYDITAEAEVLGCTVSNGDEKMQPAVIDSPWRTGEVTEPPEFMPVEDFLKEGRCHMYIETARKIAEDHPDLFLTCCMIGPLELANHMVGMENFMIATFMNPDDTLKWVEAMTPYECAYAEALSEVCDNIFVITEGAEEVLPPDQFGTYAPYEAKVFARIKECYSTAHVCGTTINVLNGLADLKPTILSVQSHGDPQAIVDRVGDRVILAGGVDPIDTLMQGTPRDIVDAAKKAADAGYPIITPECGVPPQTPDENLEALARYREL
jgi:[methyl-Co(III) methanol-specific corrinoid protein]:coenzyme M methyltransferase